MMRGSLLAIKDAITSDLLVTIEDLAIAKAFGDLARSGPVPFVYGLFSRCWCPRASGARRSPYARVVAPRAGCSPQKPRPALGDLYGALYNASKIDKTELKQVELLADVGNNAAHNVSTLKKNDVKRMIPDVRVFLQQHPIV